MIENNILLIGKTSEGKTTLFDEIDKSNKPSVKPENFEIEQCAEIRLSNAIESSSTTYIFLS